MRRSRWPDVNAFYDDRGGTRSIEYDFGVNNYNEAEHRLPFHLLKRWRVSVVETTGDVYACETLDGTVRLLGTFAARDGQGDFVARMDAAFADWAILAGRPLAWFADRIPDDGHRSAEVDPGRLAILRQLEVEPDADLLDG